MAQSVVTVVVLCKYLDLAKAFDFVDWVKLLHINLKSIVCHGKFYWWLENYLSNGKQFVSIQWSLLIRDEGLPLKDYLMKLFSHRLQLSYGEEIFNYHLSCVRRITGSPFGVKIKENIFMSKCACRNSRQWGWTCCCEAWILETGSAPKLFA